MCATRDDSKHSHRVEEEDNPDNEMMLDPAYTGETARDVPLTQEVRQRDVFEEAINNGGCLEGRGGFLDGSNHF